MVNLEVMEAEEVMIVEIVVAKVVEQKVLDVLLITVATEDMFKRIAGSYMQLLVRR